MSKKKEKKKVEKEPDSPLIARVKKLVADAQDEYDEVAKAVGITPVELDNDGPLHQLADLFEDEPDSDNLSTAVEELSEALYNFVETAGEKLSTIARITGLKRASWQS